MKDTSEVLPDLRNVSEGKESNSFVPSHPTPGDEQKAIGMIMDYLMEQKKSRPYTDPKDSTNDHKTALFYQNHWKGTKCQSTFSMRRQVNSWRIRKRLNQGPRKNNNIDGKRPLKWTKIDEDNAEIIIEREEIEMRPILAKHYVSSEQNYLSKIVTATNNSNIKGTASSIGKDKNKRNELDNRFNSLFKWNAFKSGNANCKDGDLDNEQFSSIWSDAEWFLYSDICIPFNSKMLDEVYPYVLKFVKHYISDFRRFLLDSYVGIDLISLKHFESMISEIEKFPIDDFIEFNYRKYSLPSLISDKYVTNINQTGQFNKNKIVGTSFDNLHQSKIGNPETCYKYRIKTFKSNRNTVSNENIDVPSFIVRYYLDGNKICRSQAVQANEEIKNVSVFRLIYNAFRSVINYFRRVRKSTNI